MPNIPVVGWGAISIVAIVMLIVWLYGRNYVKVPPNMVAVFTGRGKPKIVRGGARFRMPIIERVDFMSLEPLNIESVVKNVYSKDGVPVDVTAVAMVRFGSTDELIATAVERFLTTSRDVMLNQMTEILAGNLRNIVSQMTIEELNGDREGLSRKILEEAGGKLQQIGMQLDVLSLKNISDGNGYMDALGKRRIAEVKRDAEIGEANAKRDSTIQSAAAEQEGKVARAEADATIADAERELALKRAGYDAEVQSAQATASQAGPLAEAKARAAVEVAQADVDRQSEEARIAVEEQRGLRAEQAQRADTIVPAEAGRQAAILRAEGDRQATILAAEASAKSTELAGEADANARKQQASATQTEMEARAAGELATLSAQAEGTAKLAEAQNAFSAQALRLQVTTQVVETLPAMLKAIADGVDIDHLVVMDGGGSDGKGSALNRAASVVPTALFQAMQSLEALGIDLGGMLSGVLNGSSNGDSPAPADEKVAIEQ